ncbi:hypothetical protein A3B51_00585 [Candidatus Curtissbacteria bacterium RIFCSPLOWO2_01_FULL_41_18]|uniref:Uncharacterized protein n=1 Tax=Candidatus Curtissbacteria bacterium RIFCSPLOWO2_01_FULL_41_18 TaxID=1797727 RepID=A0A1F5HLX2_9BACT|nr:MAG: hypothetical protein A3B51_00585 [Candidatus Curtissbacteria bacterium RIFCSPLOWO2_01_FULL_41_18]
MINLGQKGLISGFYASIIGLLFGSAVGGLGIWTAVAASVKTPLGGWLIFLVIGSALGYLYSFFKFSEFFGKEAIIKGAAYGIVIWIASLILASIFPALGQAAFVDPIRANLFVQLMTSLVWGASLGLLFEQK